jgi:translin
MTSGSPSSDSRDDPPRSVSGVPEQALAEIEAHLRQRELRREELYQRARRLRRLAQSTMSHLHADHRVPPAVAEVRRELADLADWMRREGRGDEGLGTDALQEGVEGVLLGAIVAGTPLPGPSDLGVDPEPYLLGLGDVVGEVRRLVLDRLAHDDLAGAEAHLALMDALTRDLIRFDTTRAIVQLKPKQDTARSLLERTRGEVVMARLHLRAAHASAGGVREGR